MLRGEPLRPETFLIERSERANSKRCGDELPVPNVPYNRSLKPSSTSGVFSRCPRLGNIAGPSTLQVQEAP